MAFWRRDMWMNRINERWPYRIVVILELATNGIRRRLTDVHGHVIDGILA